MKLLSLALLSFSAFAQHATLPNPKLTPGTTDPKVTQATIQNTICVSGYTSGVRDVTEATKKAVMQRYGLPLTDLKLVEIDHFYSLELAGSNDIANLWPQYYEAAAGQTGYLGAREKDVVETHLHARVCQGRVTLLRAQQELHNWPDIYKQLKAGK